MTYCMVESERRPQKRIKGIDVHSREVGALHITVIARRALTHADDYTVYSSYQDEL